MSQPYLAPFGPLKAVETISGQEAKGETIKTLNVVAETYMYYEYVLSNNSSWQNFPNALALVNNESKLIDYSCWMAMQ